MHDGGKQMREKTVSRSREHSKDVALCGLFAALVAVGAFIKVGDSFLCAGLDSLYINRFGFFLVERKSDGTYAGGHPCTFVRRFSGYSC